MRIVIRFVLAAAAALALTGCGILQGSAEERAAETERVAALVQQRLDDRCYVVDIEFMSPLRGTRRALTSPYSISVDGTRFASNLPYMGVAYNVPYGGGKVLTFEDDIEEYIEDFSQPDCRVVAFTTDNDEDYLLYRLEVYANGKAYLRVSSRNREAIDYQGSLNPDKDPWWREKEKK